MEEIDTFLSENSSKNNQWWVRMIVT